MSGTGSNFAFGQRVRIRDADGEEGVIIRIELDENDDPKFTVRTFLGDFEELAEHELERVRH